VTGGNADDASASMDTDSFRQGAQCVGMIALAGAATQEARASWTQWNTDGFRLNWAARARTNRRSIFMAIKGGSWKVGETAIDVTTLNNTATVSGLTFAPKGIDVISDGYRAETSSGAAVTDDSMCWGCASSTSSRRSMMMRDTDATASSACEIFLNVDYDSVINQQSAATTALDVDQFNSDGFRLVVDDADGAGNAATWVGYLAFGDVPVIDLPIIRMGPRYAP
jgi:hypothetical protein